VQYDQTAHEKAQAAIAQDPECHQAFAEIAKFAKSISQEMSSISIFEIAGFAALVCSDVTTRLLQWSSANPETMCNLYSITTNQAVIIALFRVVHRYVGNLAPMPCKQPWPFGYGRGANHAGTSDRHRRGDHTDRHHAQRIQAKRDAGAPVFLLQTRHQR